MNLGSSLRRRRRGSSSDSASPSGAGARGLRVAAIAVTLTLSGFGLGYLAATQMVFPAPEFGGDLTVVPDLTAMTGAEAARVLADSGLVTGVADSVLHPVVDRGTVIGQSPLPGQLSEPGGPVRLTYSLGAETRPVPDVRRLTGERARTVLEATGLLVELDTMESPLPAGRVIAVIPEEGTEVRLPSRVLLSVSLGPPPVEMPDLGGMSEEAAVMLLDSLGLVVAEVQVRFRRGLDEGTVIDQDPPPEELVEQGTSVRLTVATNERRRSDPVAGAGTTAPAARRGGEPSS